MLFDTSFFQEFYHAEQIQHYSELMTYMKRFTHQDYVKLSILDEIHSDPPAFERDDDVERFSMPILLHIWAHILRARESKPDTKIGNYSEALQIINRAKKMGAPAGLMSKWENEARQYAKKWFKASTLVQQFGHEKAEEIKRKISESMSDLEESIIKKRNKSIKKYASKRPASHNEAIARAHMKSLVETTTGRMFACSQEAADYFKVSLSSVRKCCQGKSDSIKGLKFEYLI
jgi:hypothetical protein